MAATRASKSASKPPVSVPHDGDEMEMRALEHRLRRVEEALRIVVEELKARKVIPEVVVVRGPKRERLSPKARRERRQKLLDEARKKRWPDSKPTAAKPGRRIPQTKPWRA